MAYKEKNICCLALYRKRLSTPILQDKLQETKMTKDINRKGLWLFVKQKLMKSKEKIHYIIAIFSDNIHIVQLFLNEEKR